MKERIRLTNKTAIALRDSARRVRTAYFAAQIVLSAVLFVAGVALGMRYLLATVLMLILIVLMNAALRVAGRSRYVSLLGQAICTEAAARELRTGAMESMHKAQRDMQRVKEAIREDVAQIPEMAHREQGAQPFFEGGQADETQERQAAHRRRRGADAGLQLIRPDR